MKSDVRVTVTLRFYNEYYTGGGKGAGIIQSYLLRDIHGRPYLPASLLKGCLRHNATRLQPFFPGAQGVVGALFGEPGISKAILYFENAPLRHYEDIAPVHLLEKRTGIAIRRQTRKALDKHLFTMETSGSAGAMEFQAEIQGYVPACERALPLLYASIRFLKTMGGGKSRGLGWLAEPPRCDITVDGKSIETSEIGQWAVVDE